MKYRIKQINNKFYPQYKGFFIWSYFDIFVKFGCWTRVYFHSLIEANDYITKVIKSDKDAIIIHNYEAVINLSIL